MHGSTDKDLGVSLLRNFFHPGRSPVYAAHAAAATSHPMSTLVAVEMLRSGGNAVDAGIAAVAVQCVVDPLMTGIGGDCFALYTPKGRSAPVALNGSGRAPAAAEASWYRERNVPITQHSPHAVMVPGAIGAWARLVNDYGTRSLGEVLQPAILLAEEGFVVQSRVAWDWNRNARIAAADPDMASAYLIDGKSPAAGARMRLPKLAATLRLVAENGPGAFYEGAVANDIVTKLRALGGLHTLEDFATAQPDYVTPVSTEYRGYQVFECPPNGQGLAALMMLNVLSGYDIGKMSELDRIHSFAEASKQAYFHRNALFADPTQAHVPIDDLLSSEWSAQARQHIDPQRAQPPVLWPAKPHKDTVYLCVVDRDGNALSLINSLFEAFGSGIMSPQSGVVLNNRGFCFTLEPDHPNCVAPRKRPMNTIIPGMLMRNGETVAPFGVMGGHYQAMGHVELLTSIIDRGLDVQEALDVPRSFAHDDVLELEQGIPAEIEAELQKRGHTTSRPMIPLGSGQIIWMDRERGSLVAGSDCRKDGSAAGF
jgi:gamma-glutamyltranspeptidase/glutathione hydrolase